MNPLVSICIPTYNGESYLQEALDSVKIQTYNNIEVIISDDSSTDNTLKIVEKFKEEFKYPVKIFRHKPSGIGANWNNCVNKSNGEYIKFLFQDDILVSDCIEKQINIIQQYNLKAVCSRRFIIDEDSKILNNDWSKKYGDLQKKLDFKKKYIYIFTKKDLRYLSNLVYNIFGEPDTFLYHKSLFKKIGLFHPKYKQILDLEFSYRILKKFNIGIIDEKLLLFRIHDSQATSVNQKLDLKEHEKLDDYVSFTFFQYLNGSKRSSYLSKKIPFYKTLLKLKKIYDANCNSHHS